MSSRVGPADDEALRVLVVDDSAVGRRFVRLALEADGAAKVIAEARTGAEAMLLVDRLRPGAILMDLNLPGMSGLEAIERIMATQPTPILVYSACVSEAELATGAAAFAAGAVDVLAKPGAAAELVEHAAELRRRMRVAGRARVITHPRARLPRAADRAAARGVATQSAVDPQSCAPPGEVGLIGIGASTGGPQAVAAVLAGLPADIGVAVLVVQHIPAGFVEGLAGWLDGVTDLDVRVGQAGDRLRPGTVTLAPGGTNLLIDEMLRLRVEPAAPGQFHVPAIDVTFGSIAAALGPRAVGVLLTGMGRDGAAGLAAMRDRGARTIVQDESTSVVYGMPAAAVALGAAERVLALPEIAPALRTIAGGIGASQC